MNAIVFLILSIFFTTSGVFAKLGNITRSYAIFDGFKRTVPHETNDQ